MGPLEASGQPLLHPSRNTDGAPTARPERVGAPRRGSPSPWAGRLQGPTPDPSRRASPPWTGRIRARDRLPRLEGTGGVDREKGRPVLVRTLLHGLGPRPALGGGPADAAEPEEGRARPAAERLQTRRPRAGELRQDGQAHTRLGRRGARATRGADPRLSVAPKQPEAGPVRRGGSARGRAPVAEGKARVGEPRAVAAVAPPGSAVTDGPARQRSSCQAPGRTRRPPLEHEAVDGPDALGAAPGQDLTAREATVAGRAGGSGVRVEATHAPEVSEPRVLAGLGPRLGVGRFARGVGGGARLGGTVLAVVVGAPLCSFGPIVGRALCG